MFVGTINKAQGLKREAVVVLHPLAGRWVGKRQDLPRTRRGCVRHRGTVIAAAAAPGMLDRARAADTAARLQRDV